MTIPKNSSMNATTAINDRMRDQANAWALWLPGQEPITFGDLDKRASKAAALLIKHDIKPLDKILLFVDLSYDLYAWIIAAARLGATILVVEPWLSLNRIERILQDQRPTFFVSGWIGRLWGVRVKGVRQIPYKISANDLSSASPKPHQTVAVDLDTPCLIAFTSGTTGEPKGLVRTHGYLHAELAALNEVLHFDHNSGPDLCIFTNFALANLANGRPSLLMPGKWSSDHIKALDHLPQELKPVSVTAGPAYMQKLLTYSALNSLRNIHIGGALTENSFFERCFARFPEAEVTHVYGSSEAEPVASTCARAAVRESRSRNYFHTLCVGKPWSGLRYQERNSGLWVSGPHVSPEYLGNTKANSENKFRDQDSRLWHRMGDRIMIQNELWFYSGRDHDDPTLMAREQSLYSALGHANGFLAQDKLFIEIDHQDKLDPTPIIRAQFPEVKAIYRTKIVRDKRHRARIDRTKSTKLATLWSKIGEQNWGAKIGAKIGTKNYDKSVS